MTELLFDSPVFVFDVPRTEALTAELGRLLRAEAEAWPGVVVSNRGG